MGIVAINWPDNCINKVQYQIKKLGPSHGERIISTAGTVK
jgi:hypothetical protein